LLFAVCGRGVVVTLWDRVNRLGGMAHVSFLNGHFMISRQIIIAQDAIPLLVKQFIKCDSDTDNLEAQIFGGGYIRGASRKTAVTTVKAARRMLKKLHVEIVSEDVGALWERKLYSILPQEITAIIRQKQSG